ncbi:MAG: hypothetical protein GY850_13730 [bacterium]|nr:hypothetical protein [bacterium]
MAFVVALYRCTKPGTGIDKNMVSPTVGITINQQGGLVYAVNDTVGGNIAGSACQPGKRGK